MDQRVHPTGRGRRAGDHGFTLIEILIAIVLVGILSAVAVLGIGGLLGKAKASACAAERDSLTTAVTAYLTLNNVDTIPSNVGSGVTPMDTIRLAGLINENSKMYAIGSDGSLTPIKDNPNHCGAVATTDTVPATDPSGTGPSRTDGPADSLGPPGDFHAVAGDAQATFTWTAATTSGHGGITNYEITNYSNASCLVPPSAPLTCTITGLSNGSRSHFFLAAIMADGQSTGGPSVYVTTDAVNPVVIENTVFDPPTNLAAVTGEATVTLTWDASAQTGGFPIVKYWIIDYNGNPISTCNVLPTEPLTCTLTGLTNGTQYLFAVLVSNEVGDVTGGPPVYVTPQVDQSGTEPPATDPPATDPPSTSSPSGPLSQAQNVAAVSAYDAVTVTWNAPTSDGGSPITGYSIVDYNGNPLNPCTVAPNQPLTCRVSGLVSHDTYNFGVVASNQAGDQSSSAGAQYLFLAPR
jgi:prepilin-type N-terminal cleavage/methylation domain-containing protein